MIRPLLCQLLSCAVALVATVMIFPGPTLGALMVCCGLAVQLDVVGQLYLGGSCAMHAQ